jgi:hypothetical protein
LPSAQCNVSMMILLLQTSCYFLNHRAADATAILAI